MDKEYMGRLRETPCYYPSYENECNDEFIVGKHKWGKDGFCIICGEQEWKMSKRQRTHSIRAACPFCETPLSGTIEQIKNMYKLDNGDPDIVERTLCPNCKKYIFTVNNGMQLAYDYTPPASP